MEKQYLSPVWKTIKVDWSISKILCEDDRSTTVIAKHRASKTKCLIKRVDFDFNDIDQMKLVLTEFQKLKEISMI